MAIPLYATEATPVPPTHHHHYFSEYCETYRRYGNRWTHHFRCTGVHTIFIPGVPPLTDITRRPIIQSGFRSSSPAYPLLHIEALNSAIVKSVRPGDVDPVLYVSSLELEAPSACCHVQRGDLRFLCPVSGDCGCYISCLASPMLIHSRG